MCIRFMYYTEILNITAKNKHDITNDPHSNLLYMNHRRTTAHCNPGRIGLRNQIQGLFHRLVLQLGLNQRH